MFTKSTLAEVDFLLEVLELPAGASVLDVGCGTGRHAVELARRGYAVTGIDLSAHMLALAATAAATAGVHVEWLQLDATCFSLERRFDAAICLCEGAFGLLGAGDDPIEQPLAILRNIAASLKPGAMALMTVLNAAKMLRSYQNEDMAAGRFDPFALVETNALTPREGMPPVEARERAFVGTELILLCRLAGLEVVHLWGGTAGNWGRRPLDLDEYEIMLVARKPA
ncbi:MAG TPA: class I SAM-dependent methyltransferase [Thermoanaerobaculales bacterium]|nr:class I SAM-dependent methyltransferase [Thermoanaerobaculales bacterium]